MGPNRRPIILGPATGRAYALKPMQAVFKADEGETACAYSLSEWWFAPGADGPGAHVHEANDDTFYVFERVASTVMGDVREINVWTPPGYESGAEVAAVVYLLDGALDQDFHHIAGLGQLASVSWTFGPLIVVGVQTKERQAELTPVPADARHREAFPESGQAERFRRFLEAEVVPFVEARYGRGARRALMGESLAGLFVIDTLLSRPAAFDDYVAVSLSLWWDDRAPMRAAAGRLSAAAPAGRRLYLAMADEGGTMQEGADLLRAAVGALPVDAVELRYADRGAIATHATIYHSAAEEALRWLYPQPPYDTGPTPWYMVDGASPPGPGSAR